MMKKRKKKVLLSILLALTLIVVAWVCYDSYERNYYSQFGRYNGKAQIDDYEMIADGAGLIAHWKSTTPEEDQKIKKYGSYRNYNQIRAGEYHILRSNMKLKDNPYFYKERPSKDEYWTLSLYKIEGKTLKEEKEIDVYKLVENFDSNYIPSGLGSIYRSNGSELVELSIRSLKDPSVRKDLFLNLDTHKLEQNDQIAINGKRKPLVQFKIVEDPDSSGLKYIFLDDDSFFFDPKNFSKTQFKKTSKAYQLLEQKDTTVMILNPRNSADPYSRPMSVYELFMKKGVNLYRDATIPAELSIDGQEHTIQTKEEFDRYYELEKADKVYHERE
jgi:hypothetical protein